MVAFIAIALLILVLLICAADKERPPIKDEPFCEDGACDDCKCNGSDL
jgi:hypothetical protein